MFPLRYVIPSGRCPLPAFVDAGAVLFLKAIRREASRAALDAVGRAVVFDVGLIPMRAQRSRRQHLRNLVGGLLLATSRVAWRPTPLVALFYLLKADVRSQLSYCVDELGHALAPPAVVRNHRTTLLAAAPIVAAVAVVIARGRGGTDLDQPPSVTVRPTAEPAAVAG
jgi:hypothetical protein